MTADNRSLGMTANNCILSCSTSEIDKACAEGIIEAIYEWRLALPRVLRIESVRDWKNEGLWVLVLMCWCYRLECMVYRALRKLYSVGDGDYESTTEALHRAIFELDAIVRRAVTHCVGQLLPMSL